MIDSLLISKIQVTLTQVTLSAGNVTARHADGVLSIKHAAVEYSTRTVNVWSEKTLKALSVTSEKLSAQEKHLNEHRLSV